MMAVAPASCAVIAEHAPAPPYPTITTSASYSHFAGSHEPALPILVVVAVASAARDVWVTTVALVVQGTYGAGRDYGFDGD